MNEIELKKLEIEINNLINLRTTFYSIIVVLTGGLIGLFYNISPLNIVLFIVGFFIDYLFAVGVVKLMQK